LFLRTPDLGTINDANEKLFMTMNSHRAKQAIQNVVTKSTYSTVEKQVQSGKKRKESYSQSQMQSNNKILHLEKVRLYTSLTFITVLIYSLCIKISLAASSSNSMVVRIL